ncbi:MAG: tRNA (adenosine(37)-N6)-threonylcarbamoyltransferase complex transferase subunit TsaD [Planctomycetota bacterium]
MSLLLGLETSCDETAAAVVEHDSAGALLVRSSVVATQHDLHAEYRGVVPEIASRAHLERVLPVVERAIDEAGVGLGEIDAVAVGNRPGLIGSLIVGVSAAKALAWALGKPIVGVDHVTAHLTAGELREGGGRRAEGGMAAIEAAEQNAAGSAIDPHDAGDRHREPCVLRSPPSALPFPRLGLVVSGGHTTLYRTTQPGRIDRLGGTIDDAVGEAFDKAAVILGLPYPGGPEIDRLAGRGNSEAVRFPRSMLGEGSLDFSFSGLKTAMLYAVRGRPVGKGKAATFERDHTALSDAQRADLAASFQAAAIDALIAKLGRAVDRMTDDGDRPRAIVIGGGVSANSRLRAEAASLGERLGVPVVLPAMRYCVDNAAMIAGAAARRLATGEVDDLSLPVVATGAG